MCKMTTPQGGCNYYLKCVWQMCEQCQCINLFIIQQIFLQQYFPIPCRAISHDIARRGCYCTGPCRGYVVSQQPQCALIRIDAFERQVTWYFVWEETRHCSGMAFYYTRQHAYRDYCMLTRVIRYIQCAHTIVAYGSLCFLSGNHHTYGYSVT